jgi:hypothetical protein
MEDGNDKAPAQEKMDAVSEAPSWQCSINHETVDVHVIRVSQFNATAKLSWLLSEIEKAPGVSEAMSSEGFTGLYFKRTPEKETSALFLFGNSKWAAAVIEPYLEHYDEGAYLCRAVPFTLRLSTTDNKALGPLIWVKTPGGAKDSRNLTVISRDSLKAADMLSWLRKNDDTRYIFLTSKEHGEYAIFRVGFYADRAGLLFRNHAAPQDLHCERAVHPRFEHLLLYTMPTENISDLNAGMLRRGQTTHRQRGSDPTNTSRDRGADRRRDDRGERRMNWPIGRSGRFNPPRQNRPTAAGHSRRGAGAQHRPDQRPRK